MEDRLVHRFRNGTSASEEVEPPLWKRTNPTRRSAWLREQAALLSRRMVIISGQNGSFREVDLIAEWDVRSAA